MPESFQVSFNANYDLDKTRTADDIEISALSWRWLITVAPARLPIQVLGGAGLGAVNVTLQERFKVSSGDCSTVNTTKKLSIVLAVLVGSKLPQQDWLG